MSSECELDIDLEMCKKLILKCKRNAKNRNIGCLVVRSVGDLNGHSNFRHYSLMSNAM